MSAEEDVLGGFNAVRDAQKAKQSKQQMDQLNQSLNAANFNSVRDFTQPAIVGAPDVIQNQTPGPMQRRLGNMNREIA